MKKCKQNMRVFNVLMLSISLFTSLGCIKVTPNHSDIHPLKGTFKFRKVLRSSIDNYQTEVQQYFNNGQLFTNPLEVSGLDSIYTDFSLVKIENGYIYLNQHISGIDTTWTQMYTAQDQAAVKKSDPYYNFYPNGLKRIWKVLDFSDSLLIIDASTQWPNSTAGAAYTTTFFLEKL
jgi:hypothetical protein